MTTAPTLDLTDGTALTLIGRITTVDVRINRQENREATITLATSGGHVNVLVPPRTYAHHQDLLHVDRIVAMDVGVGKWHGETTAMAFGIQAADGRR